MGLRIGNDLIAPEVRGGEGPSDGAEPETVVGAGTDRRLLGVALTTALLPLVVSAVALITTVRDRYLPAGDLAMTELHVRDVGHHEVLVGLWSRWSWSHPGPVLFYLLAPFYWLTGDASIGLNLGALAINGAAIAGMLVIARRRGGTPLLLCTLLACLLLMRTLGGGFTGDPWNLYITVFPFALLFFLAWSMACGELWAVPVAAGVATALVQTHVGFLVLVTPMLVWGGVALVWPLARRQPGHAPPSRLVRSGALTTGVLALLWFPPLLDSFRHSPANLTLIFDYFQTTREPTHPLSDGWRVIGSQFAVTPEWLTWKRPASVVTGEPLVITSPRLPVLLVPVIGAAVWLWRRGGDHGRKLVVTLAVVLVSGVAAIVRTVGPAFDYRLRWTWVPPMLALVVVAWVGWRAATDRWGRHLRRWLAPAALVGCLGVGAVNVIAAARAGTPHERDSDVVAAITGPVLDDLDQDGGQIVVSEYDDSIAGPWYSRSLVLQLERHGFDARVPADMRAYFSRRLVEDNGPVQERLIVATDDQVDRASRTPGFQLVAQWSAIPEAERARISRELDDLAEDWEAGRLTDRRYWAQAQPLRAQLAGEGGTTATAVAVFADDGPALPGSGAALG